jgi:hypothetical protein
MRVSRLILSLLTFIYINPAKSQYKEPDIRKLGINNLKCNGKKTNQWWGNRFQAARKHVIGYSDGGKPFIIKSDEFFQLTELRTGTWQGYSGDWVEFDNHLSGAPDDFHYFVPLKDVKNVQAAAMALAEKEYAESLARRAAERSRNRFKIPNDVKWGLILASPFIILMVLLAKISGGAIGGSTTDIASTEKTFLASGRFLNGKDDGMGNLVDTSTDKTYSPTGFGDYKEKKWI